MPKVLLADDSTHAQRMGSKILGGEGIEVVTVNNGEAAVKKLAAGEFDLVMADVFMPGRSGYEVCSYIKNSPAMAPTPVILIVGLLEPYDADQGKSVGADGVLRKPFETSVVVETVRRLMEEGRKRRAAARPPDHDKTQTLDVTQKAAQPARGAVTPPAERAKPSPEPFPVAAVSATPVPAEEASVPEMSIMAADIPAPIEVPSDMQEFTLQIGDQPPADQLTILSALPGEAVPAELAEIQAIELDQLVLDREPVEVPRVELPAEQPAELAVTAPAHATSAGQAADAEPPAVLEFGAEQPAEGIAAFDFAELHMAAAEPESGTAFELLQAEPETAAVEAPPVQPAISEAAIVEEASAVPPAAPVEAGGLSLSPEAPCEEQPIEDAEQIRPFSAGAGTAVAPAPQLSMPEAAAPEATVEIEAVAQAAIEPAALAPKTEPPLELTLVPEAETPAAQAQWIIEPEPAAEADALAFAAATPEPATGPQPEATPAAVVSAAVAPEAEEVEPPKAVSESAAETAQESPAAEGKIAEPIEGPVAAPTVVEAKQPAPTIDGVEAAPVAPESVTTAAEVAEAGGRPEAGAPDAAAETHDWAELLETVESAPGPQRAALASEATADQSAPAAVAAAELREAIEAGLNAVLPNITAVPGLTEAVMREILRRFDNIR